MYPMKQVNINGTQPLGADHAVFYPVITAASTSSVAGTAPKNAIVEVFRTTNDPGLYGPGEYLPRQHGRGLRRQLVAARRRCPPVRS